jgi:hypothetical protein
MRERSLFQVLSLGETTEGDDENEGEDEFGVVGFVGSVGGRVGMGGSRLCRR